jgi:hypothetical protein
MALRPDEFYDHALAAADGEHRLPLARMTGWDISPFEPAGLRVTPLRPPIVPEPDRAGEDPADCTSCPAPGTKGSGSTTPGGSPGSAAPACRWC